MSGGIVSKKSLQGYLAEYLDNSPGTYNAQIVRLRRLIAGYLERPDIINGFKLAPVDTISKKNVPTLNQVRAGFEALKGEPYQTYYLILALSGPRKGEALGLTRDKVYPEMRAIIPEVYTRTKRSGVTFYNGETEARLIPLMKSARDRPIFKGITDRQHRNMWERATEAAGVRIMPQVLRTWFSTEMGERGIPDRYVDVFQGRSPRSVLARYYTGTELERLRRIYDKAELKICA